MSNLTALQRARLVVENFVPQDKPGHHYVYAYLGIATYEATQYEIIDGLCLASKRVWHLDESQNECVAYIGEGYKGRISEQRNHPFVPNNSECRIKLYERASKNDAQELERLIINELGCILDNKRADGCLANIRYYRSGPFCCARLESHSYKNKVTGINSAIAAGLHPIETYAMTKDKSIIAKGSMRELAKQLNIDCSCISKCCRGERTGVWSKTLGHPIYFCKADDYESFEVKAMDARESTKRKLIIALKLDGSDAFSGTALDISRYAPEIKNPNLIHSVARGYRPTVYGWTFQYVDALENPVSTCGPHLIEFF